MRPICQAEMPMLMVALIQAIQSPRHIIASPPAAAGWRRSLGSFRPRNAGTAYLQQELRSGSDPLQSWQCELSTLEDEAPLELPPGASLIQPFTFHQPIRHQT